MNSNTEQELVREVDRLIANHFAESQQTDDQGRPLAAVSAADKFSWAKHSGATLELVEERLSAVCDDATPPDEKHVVPQFRLKARTATADDGRRATGATGARA